MALTADGISVPHEHDVLSGRGKHTNNHLGNKYFRALVDFHRLEYVQTNQIAHFAELIVDDVKTRDPPGRFLIQDKETQMWRELGERRAIEKAKQALREGAPELREQLRQDNLRTLARSNGHLSLNPQAPVKEKSNLSQSAPPGSLSLSPDSVVDRKAPHGPNAAASLFQSPFDEAMPLPVPSDRSIPFETVIGNRISLSAFKDQSVLTDFSSIGDLSSALKPADPNVFDDEMTEAGGMGAVSGRSLHGHANMMEIEGSDSSFQLSAGSSRRATRLSSLRRRNSESSLRKLSGLMSESSGMIQCYKELATSSEVLRHFPRKSDLLSCPSSRRWSFSGLLSDRSMESIVPV